MANAPRECACFSGDRYKACCAPLHRGEREASSPQALMRSRFSAFALGLGPYLVTTLAPEHPDLELPREDLTRELSRIRERQRFLGLAILHASEHGERGEVLFFARIFEKGRDQSFVELSDFTRHPIEGGLAWRYASGLLLPVAKLGPTEDPSKLTPDDVRRLTEQGPS